MEFKLFLSKVFYIEGFATTISESHEVKKKKWTNIQYKKKYIVLKNIPIYNSKPTRCKPSGEKVVLIITSMPPLGEKLP